MSELKTRYIDDTYVEYYNTGNHELAQIYLKSEANKVIAEKDAEIAWLKVAAKELSIHNRACRKCGNVGTLMYLPIVKGARTYWNLYNSKGIDFVLGIQCAHCGEVAFVTKQFHEYALLHHKYKRCLAMAKICENKLGTVVKPKWWDKWRKRWLELAEKFKEAK